MLEVIMLTAIILVFIVMLISLIKDIYTLRDQHKVTTQPDNDHRIVDGTHYVKIDGRTFTVTEDEIYGQH